MKTTQIFSAWILSLGSLAVVPAAWADTVTVCASGCNYTSINAAIAAAQNGDVIQLAAQTYLEGAVINTLGKAITLRGVVNAAGEPASVLDGADSHRVLICQSGETTATVFENLVIRNGTGDYGGGMYNYNNSNPSLNNCTFTDNTASGQYGYGGGMYNNYSSSPTLTNCTFTGNTAQYGGGMFNYNSSPTLTNCTFTDNTATYSGVGMYNSASSPTLNDCTFTLNTGVGMYNNSSSSPTLTNCTFTDNTASGMVNLYSSSPTLNNCTFTGNTAGSSGGGMQSSNNSNPTLTNCILCSNTPLQISGLYTDLGGNCIMTSCYDCFLCPGDINGNGAVDGVDLAALLSTWGTDGQGEFDCDIDDDGIVSGIDLAFILSGWGSCQD